VNAGLAEFILSIHPFEGSSFGASANRMLPGTCRLNRGIMLCCFMYLKSVIYLPWFNFVRASSFPSKTAWMAAIALVLRRDVDSIRHRIGGAPGLSCNVVLQLGKTNESACEVPVRARHTPAAHRPATTHSWTEDSSHPRERQERFTSWVVCRSNCDIRLLKLLQRWREHGCCD
jgi:hypothetical protein